MSGLANLTDPSLPPFEPHLSGNLVARAVDRLNRAAIVINAGVANNPVVTSN